MKQKYYLILHNIRSAQNVGSIFRTADACGISKIFLSGYTPKPIDRFGREVSAISKTALGAEKDIEWEYFSQPNKIIDKLKKEGVEIIGIEQDKKSIDYKKIKIKKSTAFIVGNEVKGISKQLLQKCDKIAEIPMKGNKESLNVSVTTGIALFRILNI
ncbi:MAG: TrmH family RNA methyltransferase [Candidatus Pacebacteria bacterium]|nr:TrmH family RNA methyltransferase [Candidatus Paceibacterota bacterium]